MNDDSKPGWLTRLGTLLLREPEDRDQLVELLRSASERELLDEEALAMIEGVLEVSELDAGGVMLPRAQIEFIDIGDEPAQIIRQVVVAGHSRFPVIDGGKDEVIGILHAKDLLRFFAEGEDNLRGMLRPAVFVPEAKRLNVLLREFRRSRNHMAMVVDEYGGVAGLVTIEDVIEQIVGDIEDEYDFEDVEGDIIEIDSPRRIYRVKAATAIEDMNERIGSSFATEDYDTVGGLVVNAFGKVPRRNDRIELGDCEFLVLRADRRRLHLVQVIRTPVVEGQ
jgi:magnesium and cobalt transporter